MQIYDISLSISEELPTWPGDPTIKIERVQKMENGADANVTHLSMTAHTGTHIDAPYHFLGNDAITIEQIDLNQLVGRAYMLQISDDIELITANVLKNCGIPPRTKRLLIKTRNSDHWKKQDNLFDENFVAISPDGAQYLINRGIKLIGVDYLSVAPYADGKPTHKLFLEAGIIIVEGLDLSEITQGRYTLYCLPLKIIGADGSPARAILIGV
jgi:arylformamidase